MVLRRADPPLPHANSDAVEQAKVATMTRQDIPKAVQRKAAPAKAVKALSLRRMLMVLAWGLLLLIVFWTLGPIADRPRLGPPQLERFGAYFLLGGAFSVAYARPRLVASALVLVAVGLEFGQLFVPHRDAGIPDAVAKATGAIVGVGVGTFIRTRTSLTAAPASRDDQAL